MKKVLTFLLAAVMATAFLGGCSDPVYDDFENFLNVEMKEVNENYEKITAEAANWETLEDDAALEKSISDVLLPLVNDSIEKLNDINPETEEVQELKEKYAKVMEAYKKGFEDVLEGCKTQDVEVINAGNERLGEGIELLGEYNTALEAMAEEVGAEIEY